MPVITNDKSASPYFSRGTVTPDYTFNEARIDTLGSSDTIIGRMFDNYYDRAHMPWASQINQRYYNQGRGAAIANNITRLASAVPSGVIGLANTAIMLTPPGMAHLVGGTDNFLTAMDTNPVGELYKGWKGMFESSAPLFVREDFNNQSFLQQLARPGEMVSANNETLQFLVEMFATSGALAYTKVGTKAARYLVKNKPLFKALTSLEAPNVTGLANTIDMALTNAALTVSESFAEAKEFKENQIKQKTQERLLGNNNLTEGEIEKSAANGMENVFWENMAVLAFSNGVFLKLVKPWFKPAVASSRDNIFGIAFKEGKYQLPKTVSEGASKFERFWYDKGYTPGVVTKSLLQNVFTEGLEEDLQYSIQKMNEIDKLAASEKSFLGTLGKYYDGVAALADFSDPERVKAIGLGSLLGGAQVGISSAFGAGPTEQANAFRKSRDQAIENLNKGYTDYLSTNVFEKTPDIPAQLVLRKDEEGNTKYINKLGTTEVEINQQDYQALATKYNLDPLKGGAYTIKGTHIFDKNGQPIKNGEKVEKFYKHMFKEGEIDDLMEQEMLRGEPDKFKLALLQKERLAALALPGFQSGTTDILLERLESLKNSTDAELVEMGVLPEDVKNGQIDSLISHVLELEKLWGSVTNSTEIGSNSKELNEINSKRKEYLYSLGSRMLTLDSLIRDGESEFKATKDNFLSQYDEKSVGAVENVLDKLYQMHKTEADLDQLFNEQHSLESQILNADISQDVARKRKIEEKLVSVSDKIEKNLLKRGQLSYESKDLPLWKEVVAKTEAEKLAQLGNKVNFMTDARQTLGKQFDTFIHTRSGFKAFQTDIAKASVPTSIFDRGVENLKISPSITPEAYDFYEERTVKRLHFKEKVQRAEEEFFAEFINDFIEWFQEHTSLVDAARSLSQVYADLIERKPRLYQDSVDKLTKAIAELNGYADGLMTPLTSQTDIPIDAFILETLDELEGQERDDFTKLVQAYNEGKQIKEALGVLATDPGVFDSLNALVGGPPSLLSDEELREKVALDILEPSNRILEVSGYNSGTISDEYTDDASALYEATKLEHLLKNVISHKDHLVNIAPLYESNIEALHQIAEQAKINKQNREVKERKENAVYDASLLEAVGINPVTKVITEDNPIMQVLLTLVDRAVLEAITQTAAVNPHVAAMAISDILQGNKEVITEIGSILDEYASTVGALFKETFPSRSLTSDEIRSLATSPLRVFKHLFGLIDRYERVDHKFASTEFKNFVKNYDILTLLQTRRSTLDTGAPNPYYVDRGNAGVDNTKADMLVSVYLKMTALSKLLTQVKSEKDNSQILKALHDFASVQSKAKQPRPVPSIGQERVITELVSFFTSPPKLSYHVFENVGVLKAPPGAGKSVLIAPLAVSLSGLDTKQVLIAGSTDKAAANIASAVGSATSSNVDTLIDSLENNRIGPDIQLIVVDEVGPIPYEKIDQLAKAFAKYNRDNTARVPMKMLFIYDPNQVTAGYREIPNIEETGYLVPSDLTEEQLLEAKLGNYALEGWQMFTQNLYDIAPLTTSYRSDVAQIVDLFTAFASSTGVVSGITASSNIDPKVSTDNLLGTYVEADNKNMTSILRRSIISNPDRSRAIIVGNEARKDEFVTALSSEGIPSDKVDVLTVAEAQGLTIDEVYVDIRTTDSPEAYPKLFNNPTHYNKYMNTAISRAALFAYVANVVGTNTVDNSIPDKVIVSKATKVTDYDAYLSNKKEQLDLLAKLTITKAGIATKKSAPSVPTQQPPVVAPDEVDVLEETEVPEEGEEVVPIFKKAPPLVFDEEVTERVTEVPEVVTEEADLIASEEGDDIREDEVVGPQIPLRPAAEGQVSIFIQYPSNYVFSALLGSAPLEVGDPLLLVKDTYVPSVRDGYKERILVVRAEGDGRYRLVGILSDKERPEVERTLGVDFKTLKGKKFIPQGDDFFAQEEVLNTDEYIPVFVGENSRGLTYYYDDGEPSTIFDENGDNVISTFNLWASTLLGPNFRSQIENYDEIMADPSKYLSFKVFASPTKIDKYFAGRRKPRVMPKLNVPYLVISGVKLTTDKDVLVPQFIRATSKQLNRSTPISIEIDGNGNTIELTMQTLEEFAELVRQFQEKLSTSPAMGVYSNVRMGMPFTDGGGKIYRDNNSNEFFIFHALIKALSEQYQRRGAVPIKVLGHGKDNSDIKGLSEAIKAKFPDLDPANISEELLVLAAKIDSMQHFGDANAIVNGEVGVGAARNFDGYAQIVMNKLAAANFFVTLNETTGAVPMILRDYQSHRVDNSIRETMVGKRLLGPVTAVRNNRAYNPLVKNSLIKKLRSYAASLEKRGKTDSIRYKLVTETLAKVDSGYYDVQTPPLTLDQLQLLLNSYDSTTGKYNVSEGFGLRAPVALYYSDGDVTMSSWNLGTTFKGVSPTRIELSTTAVPKIEKPVKEKATPNIKQYLQEKGGGLSTEKLGAHIVKAYSPKEIEEFISDVRAENLSKAIEEYVKISTSPSTLRKISVTLARTVKNIAAVLTSTDSAVEALSTLYNDNTYWKEDAKSKFGPRDTVRLATLIHMFPQIATSPALFQMAARFRQLRWYRNTELWEFIAEDKVGLDRLKELVDAAFKIAHSYGIASAPPTVVSDQGVNIEAAVEYIAETVGHAVREVGRMSHAVPLEEGSNSWVNDLATLVYNTDVDVVIAEYVKEHLDEAKSLGIPTEGTDRQIRMGALQYVVENAITPTERSMRLDLPAGEMLSDRQVRELYEKLISPTPIPFLRRIFGKKNSNAYRIIKLNEMIHGLGKKNWGLYKDGIISLARDPFSGMVGDKVVRHEAMHHIIWGYLTSTDRAKLFQLGREVYGDLPLEALEERIVDAFANREYAKPNSIWEYVADVVRKILRFLGFTYNNLKSLDTFFNSVDSSYYGGKPRNVVGVERNMKISNTWKIKDPQLAHEDPDFTAVEAYDLFEELLFKTFDEIYNGPRKLEKAMLFSYEEALELTFKRLTEYYNDPSQIDDVSARKVQAALGPILDPSGQARKDILREFFPQTREAERIAVAISDLHEEYSDLLEQYEALPEDTDSELNKTIKDALTELEEEIGLQEELFDTELRNPTTKLSGRVKQRLSVIEYLDKGKLKRAPAMKVYNTLLKVIPQSSNVNFWNFIDGTLATLAKIYPLHSTALVQKTVGAAAHQYLRNTFQELVEFEKNAAKHIMFRKDVNSLKEYAIISLDKSPLENVTKTDVTVNPRKYAYIERHEQESLHSFAQRISVEYKTDYDAIRNSYYLFEEVSFVTSLISSMASLRENTPHTGITYFNWGMRTERYFPIRKSGPSYILEADIISYLSSYVDNRRKTDDAVLLPERFNSIIDPSDKSKENYKEKLALINEFLNLIGVNKDKRVKASLKTSEFDKLYYSFYYFIQDLENGFRREATEEEIEQFGEVQYSPVVSLMSDQHNFLSKLTDALADTVYATDVVSYRRGDGKQAYRYIDASFQSGLLNYIVEALSNAIVATPKQNPSLFEHLVVENGIIKTSTPLLKNNIYVNNNIPAATIHRVIDHDSMKNYGGDAWARYLRSEVAIDFHRRNFSFGFLANMRTSATNRYIQFLPIPANRSSIQGVEVSFLDEKQIEKAVKQILKGELTKPDPKTAGLTNNAAYVKNYNQVLFPGIVTKSGLPISRDYFLSQTNGDVKKAVELAYKMYLTHAQKAVVDVTSDIISEEIILDETNLKKVVKRTGAKVPDFSRKEYLKARRQQARGELASDKFATVESKYEANYKSALNAAVKAYYDNFIVNQYSLSQLVYGDSAFYKSKEDETKRIQIATATGDVPLIDPVYGLPETSNVLVLEDIQAGIPLELDYVRDDSFGEEYDATDAQGYVLPEFYEKMATAYSIESNLDITLKPVYNAVHANGEVVSIKYSLVVLTDELVKDNPHLANLRESMRNYTDANGKVSSIDQVIFNSALKVGNPPKENLTRFDGKTSKLVDIKGRAGINHLSVIKINNKHLKLQLNPAKTTDASIRNPSQGTAFMNTNGRNVSETNSLHILNSLVTELGLKEVMNELEISAKGGLSKHSLEAIRKKLISFTSDLPGAEDINELLSYKKDGEYGVALDAPLLAKKVTSAFTAYISRSTVGFRFPGAKLVLQAEVGISENLAWKDKDGYTEVLLPETMRHIFKEGDVITDGAVAFRIPSTNFHSLLALKVKGFHSVPKGSKGNIIIAPSLIVHYHGSDYDIDTLFVIRKRKHEGDSADLNKIISKYNPKHKHNPDLSFSVGNVYGFKGKHDETLPIKLLNEVNRIERSMKALRTSISSQVGERRLRSILKIKDMEADYRALITYTKYIAQNNIVDIFSKALRDDKNRTDLLTPITFGRVSNNKYALLTELNEDTDELIDLLKEHGEITSIKRCL